MAYLPTKNCVKLCFKHEKTQFFYCGIINICYTKGMVVEKIRNTIKTRDLVKNGEHIIVGLSGGPDSVCLFHGLIELSKEIGFTLSAVHVNHKFRPGAAEEDQAYVENLCKEYGIDCTSFVYDCNAIAKENGLSGEEAGRFVRYESFYKTGKQLIDNKRYEATNIKIAVAHNLNDQAETVLMRIIRGTGVDGLAGIEYSRKGEYGTTIIRPLLDVSRDEIEDYCEEHNLKPRIDHTNSMPVYTRNKIRLNLIPEIEREFNSNFMESLNRLSKIAKEDKAYFEEQVENYMSQAATFNDGLSLSLEDMRAMPPAIRHRVVRRAFESIGLTQGISAAHIEAADNIIDGSNTSATTDFPKGYAVSVSYGEVRFFRNDPESMGHVSDERIKAHLGINIVENTGQLRDLSKNGTKRYAAFDYGKIAQKLGLHDVETEQVHKQAEALRELLQFRTRRQGDWIVPLGMNGSKKVQDLFVDEKVYKECRDIVPLVCIGDEVLWMIGDEVSGYNTGLKRGRISEKYKLDDSTAHIVLLEFLAKM